MADERILIADDEVDVLDTCTRVLEMQGYQITGVHSGFEAIEAARRNTFDLLLTDIKMPGMTGLQAFRAIKQHQPEIVGVAITGYGAVDTAIEALKLGMDDLLLKPFSLDDLRGAITKALEKKRLERENARLKAIIPFFELSQAFIKVTDVDKLLQQVLQIAVQETSANLGVLELKDESSAESKFCAIMADGTVQNGGLALRLNENLIAEAIKTAQAVIWQSESSQEPFLTASADSAEVTAGVVLPLVINRESIGILGLAKKRKSGTFTRSDVELLSVLASQAAIAIQNARLFTDIRAAYENLQQLDRLKSEFVSNVSHELRAPLHTIGGFVQLLLDGKVADQATQTECLETVYRQTQHLTRLIDDLLDVSRIEAGHMQLNKAPTQMHDVIKEVVKELQPLAIQKHVSLTDQTTENLPLVLGDAQRLGQVVRNLVHNAIKFTPENGRITVSSTSSADQIVIAVEDNGTGIPAEAMSHLFERFYQVDGSSTRRVGGTGLGLYISRQLVTAHGGSIWVDSEPGVGSTFRFSVPCDKGPSAGQ
jgi:signal transduction histidine kinase/FixJ family two-component response regulator